MYVEIAQSCRLKPSSCCSITAVVDGSWTEWTKWGDCSMPCGKGVQHRRRICDNPPPMNGGLDCTGPDRDQRECGCDPNFNASGITLNCLSDAFSSAIVLTISLCRNMCNFVHLTLPVSIGRDARSRWSLLSGV